MNEVFSVFLQTIIAAGVVAYAVGQFRNGKYKTGVESLDEAKKTIDILQSKSNVFEQELKDAKKQQQEHHDEIIRLQEALKHEKEKSDGYLAILRDQNPETKKFMSLLTEAAVQSKTYMETTGKVMMELKFWMESVDKRLSSIGTRSSDTKI